MCISIEDRLAYPEKLKAIQKTVVMRGPTGIDNNVNWRLTNLDYMASFRIMPYEPKHHNLTCYKVILFTILYLKLNG